MGTPSRNRLLGGLLALTFAVTAGGWLSANLAAQDPKKEEKEDAVKPKKKAPEVEDDEPAKPRNKGAARPPEQEDERPSKPRKVIKVDDEDSTPAKPANPRPKMKAPPEPQSLGSIADALQEAKNSTLREFFNKLLKPHDEITVRGLGDTAVTHAIEPVSRYYVGEQPHFPNGSLRVRTYDAEWKLSQSDTPYVSALRVEPYEEVVLDAVDELLKKDPARLKLTQDEVLKAAETVLAAADRFHVSARETGARRGDEWQAVGKKLHERLFGVQRQRLESFVTADDWGGALAYARTLADAYRDPEERGLIAAPLVKLIQSGLPGNADAAQLRVARERFRQLDEIFPGSQAGQAIQRSLRGQAQRLLDEAKALEKGGKHDEARLRMQLAADIFPALQGLDEAMARLDLDHPVLRVGVRELPQNMIPGQAVTDMELRAVELMYEGLVKLRVDPGVGQRYVPALAAGPPRLIPLGREFRIARGATWPDGSPVTVGDVRATLLALRSERWVGYSPLWNKMLDEPEGGGDSFRLSLRLSQGYLDPLSLMTFKVMPQTLLRQGPRPASVTAAGSGPFKYIKTDDNLNRKTALFLANPAYSSREGKLGLPRVREIHLVLFANEADDPAEALQKGQIDVVLDLSAAKAANLRGKVEVRGPMTNRRVYFLAVNQRAGQIRGNLPLRQALALAVDRQTILKKFFGEDRWDAKVYHSLNGPFPAGSWPCADPKKDNVPAELYNPDDAKTQAREAVKAAGGPIRLTLKYAAGDPATRAALAYLCETVNNELRIDDKTFIELKPEEVEPHKLREDVEESHQYELAYYHYDHPSEAYWVAPLFDISPGATGINGSNYLGYVDGELQAEFQRAKDRRDFGEVQQAMHLIHRMLVQKMPLIPLWQLDTFLAYRRGLNLDRASVDPLLIFNDVEQWELVPRR